ncbi:MAG: potassium channel family protein [Saccharofermentanales bacterium]
MRIIIIGGGKVAYYLIKTLQRGKHEITLIELRKDVCEKIATDFEVDVYNGDGTNINILEDANCQDADFLIAVTGKDENNLIACEIGKKKFNVKQTVAKVNNPKNIEMFVKLGVDKPVSSTQILADLIEQEVDFRGMSIALKIEETSKAIIEFFLSEKSAAIGKALKDYKFPGDSKIAMIKRANGSIVMPHGNTVMESGDKILMITDENLFEPIWKSMVRK